MVLAFLLFLAPSPPPAFQFGFLGGLGIIKYVLKLENNFQNLMRTKMRLSHSLKTEKQFGFIKSHKGKLVLSSPQTLQHFAVELKVFDSIIFFEEYPP